VNADPAESGLLPRVERDGVLATEHAVRVQVHSQRIQWRGTLFQFPSIRLHLWKLEMMISDMSDEQIVWESGSNRQDTTPASGVQLIPTTSWR